LKFRCVRIITPPGWIVVGRGGVRRLADGVRAEGCRTHVAHFLGIPSEELHLLDRGRGEVLDSDVPTLAKRIGRQCDEHDLRRLLEALRKIPGPYDFVARIGGCSVEWKARRAEGLDAARFLGERFPDPLERAVRSRGRTAPATPSGGGWSCGS
jgi:hypothetical protein